MALNIKDPEAHRLAQELTEVTGRSMTEAVTQALKDALAKTSRATEPRLEQLEQIALHCAALPLQDERSADEILGYNDVGLAE